MADVNATLNYLLQKVKDGGASQSEIDELREMIDSARHDINNLASIVDTLKSYGKVFGADIYILPNSPSAPKEGDLWYNTNDIRTT